MGFPYSFSRFTRKTFLFSVKKDFMLNLSALGIKLNYLVLHLIDLISMILDVHMRKYIRIY